jgi:hypothetical protein
MRWLYRSLVALVVLWAVYIVSPYVGLYNLAKAVEAGDLASIQERVDFKALRLSLGRQIARSISAERETNAPRAALSEAAAPFVAAMLEPYVSPAAVLRLTKQGWPRAPHVGRGAPEH